MGATEWIYYTPYQEDISQAFQKLRQEVNESEGYDQIFQQLAEMSAEEFDQELADSFEGGTGTIYDLVEVEAFKADLLLHYFGTEKPTRQQADIAFARGEIWNSIPRDKGYYIILYENDAPNELLFAGATGD